MQSSIVKTLSLAGVTLSLMGAGVPSVVAAADANTAGQPTEQTTSKPGETAKPGDKDKPATGTDTGKPVTPPVTTPAKPKPQPINPIPTESLGKYLLSDQSKEADLKQHLITFHKTKNTRDIGGYQTADGKWQIKPNSLLRSDALNNLDADDIKLFTDKYRVKQVVDFRTPGQASGKGTDKVIPGAPNINLSVLGAHAYADGQGDGAFYVQRLEFGYPAVMGYRQFLNMVLKNEGGAFLYHCTSGKDRTGIATVLLMSIFGMDKQTMVNDFMLSQYTGRTVKIEWISEYFREIEQNYGSLQKYINDVLGFTPAQQEQLKAKYLISTDGKNTPYVDKMAVKPTPAPTPAPVMPAKPDKKPETATPVKPTPAKPIHGGAADKPVKGKKVKILSTKKLHTKFTYKLKANKKWFKDALLAKVFGKGHTPKHSAKKWQLTKIERVKISGKKYAYYQVKDHQGHTAWILKAHVVKVHK